MASARLDRWLTPRRVFPLLAAIVLLVVLFAPEPDLGEGVARLTTYSADPYGARGLYSVVQHLGWRVDRRVVGFRGAMDTTATYAVLAPPIDLTATEVATLLGAVRRGARLLTVVADGESPLSDTLRLRASYVSPFSDLGAPDRAAGERADPAGTGATPAGDSIQPFNAFQRFTFVRRALKPSRPLPAGAEVFLSVRDRRRSLPSVVGLPFGAGRIVVFADANMLRNGIIRQGDAAVFAVRMLEWLGAAPGTTIVFDEYHQGFGERGSAPRAIRHALLGTATGRMLVQGVIAMLILLLAVGVRPIAPVARRIVERRSPLEHVGALSRAYEQIGATRTATRRLVQGLRRRHPIGTGGTVADERYLDLLRARHAALTPDVELLRGALIRTLAPAEFVTLGQAVDHIEQVLAQ